MADMYSIVKKQDEKIDGLLKIAKENKDLLTGIDTRLVSTPEQTSTAPSVPDKIQVELPENVATNESVKAVVEAALKQQKIDSLKSLDFSQFPEKLAEAFAKAFKDGLDKNVTKALHVGIRNEFTNQINGLNESAKKLTDRMYNIVNGAIWAAIPKWVYAIAGAWVFHFRHRITIPWHTKRNIMSLSSYHIAIIRRSLSGRLCQISLSATAVTVTAVAISAVERLHCALKTNKRFVETKQYFSKKHIPTFG